MHNLFMILSKNIKKNFKYLIISMKLPMELQNNKLLLDNLIFKMRFQNLDPIKNNNKACMTYKSIGSIVNRSVNYCR